MPRLITIRRPNDEHERIYLRYARTDRCLGAPVRSGDITGRQYYEIQIGRRPAGTRRTDAEPVWSCAGWVVKLPRRGLRRWMAVNAVTREWTRPRSSRDEAAEDVLDRAELTALTALPDLLRR